MDTDREECHDRVALVNGVPCVINGVPIDSLTMDGTIDRIGDLIERGRATNRTYQVATVNVDFLVNALSDPEVMRLLQAADLNLADGMPLVWASRWLGSTLPERVAGADLVPALGNASQQRGWKVHLLGAGPGVADRARRAMITAHPGAHVTSDGSPTIGDARLVDEDLVERIEAIDPDILCVAFGNPKQERFIAAYRDHLRCPVMIGIGGSLDMLVGDKQRAPRWVQRLGVEWIFRAAQEPRRLGRRYAHDIRIFGPALAAYIRRARHFRDAESIDVSVDGTRLVVRSRIDPRQPTDAGTESTRDRVTTLEIDLTKGRALNPAAHAMLIGLLRDARRRGNPLEVVGISPSIQRCLSTYGTKALLDQVLTQS